MRVNLEIRRWSKRSLMCSPIKLAGLDRDLVSARRDGLAGVANACPAPPCRAIRIMSLRALVLGFAVGALSSCGLGRPLALQPIAAPHERVKIWAAHASDLGGDVLVYGLVRRRNLLFAPSGGHLHIEAWLANAPSPVWVDTRWIGLSSRGRQSGRFSATLPIADPAQLERIVITYRAKPHH